MSVMDVIVINKSINARDKNGGFVNSADVLKSRITDPETIHRENTTLTCLITNANITKAQANKVAQVMQNGYAKAISPVHTSADGDISFCMARGDTSVNVDALCQMACDATEKAIQNAVKNTESAYGIPGVK